MCHKFLVLTVKKWLKSVYICRSYRKIKTGVSLFLDHPVYLPQHVTSAPSTSVFRGRLKAFLFRRSLLWLSPQGCSACALCSDSCHFLTLKSCPHWRRSGSRLFVLATKSRLYIRRQCGRTIKSFFLPVHIYLGLLFFSWFLREKMSRRIWDLFTYLAAGYRALAAVAAP